MPLNNAQVAAILQGDLAVALDLATAVAPHNLQRGQKYDSGTGAGQADIIWTDHRTLAPSATEDLDLAGTLVPLIGTGTVTFARLKAVMFYAAPGNTNNVVVGANVAANALSTLFGPTGASGGTVTIRPGGGFLAWCGGADATGWAVTASTADLIHVANSAGGTSVDYDVALIGCSA